MRMTVAGLSRLKALTACRNGRPRTQSVKIVWHDSPEHALLADGLTLAEQRGVRHLERVFPGADTWLPAQPVPVVGDPATLPTRCRLRCRLPWRRWRLSRGGRRPACINSASRPSS